MTAEVQAQPVSREIPQRLFDSVWKRVPPILGLKQAEIERRILEIGGEFGTEIDACITPLRNEAGTRYMQFQDPEGNAVNLNSDSTPSIPIEQIRQNTATISSEFNPFENLDNYSEKNTIWREFLSQIQEGSSIKVLPDYKVIIYSPLTSMANRTSWHADNLKQSQITVIDFESWSTNQFHKEMLTPKIFNSFIINNQLESLNLFKLLKIKNNEPIWYLPSNSGVLGFYSYTGKVETKKDERIQINNITNKFVHLSSIIAHELFHKRKISSVPQESLDHEEKTIEWVDKLSKGVGVAAIINTLLFVGGIATGSMFAMFVPTIVLTALIVNSYRNLHNPKSELGKAVNTGLNIELDPRILNIILSWKLWEKGFIHSPETDENTSYILKDGKVSEVFKPEDWYIHYLPGMHKAFEYIAFQVKEALKLEKDGKILDPNAQQVPVQNTIG